MRGFLATVVVPVLACALCLGCGSAPSSESTGDAGQPPVDIEQHGADAGADDAGTDDAGVTDAGTGDAGTPGDAGAPDGGGGDAGSPGSYVRPYGPNAPWNRPVRGPQGQQLIARHANSDELRSRHWRYSPSANGSKPGNININVGHDGYTYPVYVASSSTAQYPVQTQYSWANMNGRSMPWNPAWLPAGGSDAQIIVIDPGTGREWNLWQVQLTNGIVQATNANLVLAGEANVGASQDPYAQAGDYFTKENGFSASRGCGIQYLAMLVRPGEVADGAIRHALSMPVANPSKTTFVPPATKLEHPGTDGTIEIPEGMRFALDVSDADIQAWLDGLPQDLPNRQVTVDTARVIAVALRDYGWFITDTSGGAHLQFEDVHSVDGAWRSLGLDYGTSSSQFVSNSNHKTYPQDLLDGLLQEARIYALVPSDAY